MASHSKRLLTPLGGTESSSYIGQVDLSANNFMIVSNVKSCVQVRKVVNERLLIQKSPTFHTLPYTLQNNGELVILTKVLLQVDSCSMYRLNQTIQCLRLHNPQLKGIILQSCPNFFDYLFEQLRRVYMEHGTYQYVEQRTTSENIVHGEKVSRKLLWQFLMWTQQQSASFSNDRDVGRHGFQEESSCLLQVS